MCTRHALNCSAVASVPRSLNTRYTVKIADSYKIKNFVLNRQSFF